MTWMDVCEKHLDFQNGKNLRNISNYSLDFLIMRLVCSGKMSAFPNFGRGECTHCMLRFLQDGHFILE